MLSSAISLELIPRSADSLLRDALCASQYPLITHLNIPDIDRFPIRSVEAAWLLRERFGSRFNYVPHVRAIAPFESYMFAPGDFVLAVHGDAPENFSPHKDKSTLEYISDLKSAFPVMAAIDPYRSSFAQEVAYMKHKIVVGASGFFTQPFFSLQHLRYWDTLLPRDLPIYYGVTPVTTEGTLSYWRDKNHVVFPDRFSLSLRSQVRFARSVIRWSRAHWRNVYLMPIKVPVQVYLEAVFAK